MPNSLSWSYVWPRLLILVPALALAILAGSGMVYWKLQQSTAGTRLLQATTQSLNAADDVVIAAGRQARGLPDDVGREALAEAATELRALTHVLSMAAYRAGGPVIADDGAPALTAGQTAAAEAVMPAKALTIWLKTDEGGASVADAIAAVTDEALTVSADITLVPAAVQQAATRFSQINGTRIRPTLSAMRDTINAALAAEGETTMSLLAMAAGIVIAAATVLFVILPVAMMRRIRSGDTAASVSAPAKTAAALTSQRRGDRVRLNVLADLENEIRNSVSGIAAMTELMAGTGLDEKQRSHMTVIARSGTTLLNLTGNAIDYARSDCDMLALNPAPFALRELVERSADSMASAAAARNLKLAIRVASDLPEGFLGDAARIRQVLCALVDLAIETSEPGTVVIDVSGIMGANATASLALRVRPCGSGLHKHDLKTAFDAYERGSEDDDSLDAPARLRLALAGRLARLMHGKISTETAASGATTLTATLNMPVDPARKDVRPLTTSIGTGRRLLVIDADETSRDILVETARSIGFEAVGAEDGRLGGLLANHMAGLDKPLDLIVIDSRLGAETGLGVAETLQADEQVKGTAMVLMTAPGETVSEDELHRNAIVSVLTRPVGPLKFAATARHVLESNRDTETGTDAAATPAAPLQPQPNDTAPLRELASVVGMPAARPAPPPIDDEDRLDVLVAEDNEVNQLVFSQILEGLGLRFCIAVNGADAVENFKVRQPRLILMDVSMPEMNGLEATRAIREIEKSGNAQHTPIIGVTAHSLRGDQEKCMEAGMDDYMAKPVSPDMIGAKIAKWMERRRPSNDRRRA